MFNNLIVEHVKQKRFLRGFTGGLSLVFIAGFGDKTFFINMIYVSNTKFWEAIFVSLCVSELMNLFSILLGKIIPLLINRDTLDWIAIAIFLFFGIAMILEGWYMENDKIAEHFQKEIEEEQKEKKEEKEERKELLDSKGNFKDDEDKKCESENILVCNENNKMLKLGVFDTWWKYCIAYLVGELGDKSQIATIIATTKYNFFGVLCGTALAQFFLVITSMILGKSISNFFTSKQITFIGGFTFLLFAFIFIIEKFIEIL